MIEDSSGVREETDGRVGKKLAPFNPTNLDAVSLALELLQIHGGLTPEQQEAVVLYDLGCGDARLLVEVCFLMIDFCQSWYDLSLRR